MCFTGLDFEVARRNHCNEDMFEHHDSKAENNAQSPSQWFFSCYVETCVFLLDEIIGIWFYDEKECQRFGSMLIK